MAPLGPVVDDVGLDTDAVGDVGDAELGVAAGLGVDVAVLVGGAEGAVAAGGFEFGREGDAPAVGRSTAGGQDTGVDPVVDRSDRYADPLGDLAGGSVPPR